MSRLAQAITAAYIGGDPVSAMFHEGEQIYPPLADGVWDPQPGTWAVQAEDYIHPEARILVLEEIQRPFTDMPSITDGLQPLPASPNNYLNGFTAIFEFRTPTEKIPPATPYRVVDFASGAHMDIVGDAVHDEAIIGALKLTSADGTVTHLSFVGKDQRMRYVSSVRQVGNVLHNFFATDGANLQHQATPLPDGVVPGVGASNYNAELTGVVGGFVLAWPFGDTVPAVGDPEVDWVRAASARSPGNGIMEIPIWPDPQPESAESSSAPPTEKVQEPLEFVDGSVSAPSFLETLPEFYNWGQHQTDVTGQRDIAPIGNPEFIFDGNIDTTGNARSASWQSCSIHFPSVPVSRIVVDRLNFPCALTIDGAQRTISQGDVIDFDPPNVVDRLDIGVGTGNRSDISISVLGPHPIYVDGEPLMVDGVPVYSE